MLIVGLYSKNTKLLGLSGVSSGETSDFFTSYLFGVLITVQKIFLPEKTQFVSLEGKKH